MSELLSCPFCGGEAALMYPGGRSFEICCMICNSETDVFDSIEEAIAAWNTRAERTCHDIETRIDYWQCSECGVQLENPIECPTLWDGHKATAPSFCPGCGARVKGD